MERKSLIVLAVLVTLSVITPNPDGIAATGANVAAPVSVQPALVGGISVNKSADPRCARFSSGEVLLALPGNTSI